MDLARPGYLWLSCLVPLLLAWVIRGRLVRLRRWSALGQVVRPRGDGDGGWLAAIVFLIVALAGPRWGRVLSPPLPPGRDVVLLVDTSRSMGVEDAVPDRLAVAVETAETLVEALGREEGDRVALVAFAGRGVVRAPLTENLGAVVDALRALRPGDVRPGGTHLGAAIGTALDAFGDEGHAGGRTILVFSDGEDHVGAWEARRDRLREAGVVVHALAVGDADRGHPVPSGRGSTTLTYRGEPVLSRRSDRALAAIARMTGGAFVPLGLAPIDLGALFVRRIDPVARQDRLVFRASGRVERSPWFVLAALGLALAASWPGRHPGSFGIRRGQLVLRAGAIATLGLGLGVGMGAGTGTGAGSVDVAIEEGRTLYEAGRWAEALAAFERALAADPGGVIPRYDAAAALFQVGRYAEALDHYSAARGRAGAGLRTKIDYALGNTSLALGDVAGAIRHYDACLASKAPGADLDRVRRDAAINRRFAEEASRRPRAPEPRDGGSNSSSKDRPTGSDDRDATGREPDATSGPGPAPAGGEPGEGNTGRRGAGGAGRSGVAPPRAGSPEDRLDEAVRRVREARRRRLPDSPPPPDGGNAKDW